IYPNEFRRIPWISVRSRIKTLSLMLKKILFRESTNVQFIFATLGALIGLTSLLLSLQLILDVQSFHSNEEELFGPNSVVIQKKVTKLTTIGMNSTEFTASDIQSLKDKE